MFILNFHERSPPERAHSDFTGNDVAKTLDGCNASGGKILKIQALLILAEPATVANV